MRTPIAVGMVGLGAWGRRLARGLDEHPQTELRWLCDRSAKTRLDVRRLYPAASDASSLDELLDDESLDAVAIATPPETRRELAKRALEAEKHVLVRSPLALGSEEADELVRLAEQRGRCLMVVHLLLLHPAIRKLKELIDLGRLGELYYLTGTWQGLGRPPAEESVLWRLGADAVATVLHLVDDEPVEVIATGDSYLQPAVTEVASCYLRFATGITANLHLSSLHPHRVARLTAVGSKRAGIFDGVDPERKLTIYEQGSGGRRGEGDGALRSGEIVSPRIALDEPFRAQCDSFVAAVRRSGEPADARLAAATVSVLETLERSMRGGLGAAPAPKSAKGGGRLIPLPTVMPARAK
jgi:predicted dehydrogenase